MSRKKLTIITILSIAILTCSYFVAANFGFFSGGTNAPSVPEDTMTRGLVGYWEFDEGTGQTAYDGSDSSNDGRLGSTTSSDDNDPVWTDKGKNAGALDFDGIDDRVYCGNDSSLELTGEITSEAWINLSEISTTDDMVITFGSGNHYFEVEQTTGLLEIYLYGTTSPGYHKTTDAIPTNVYTHVAFTYDGSKVKLYVNGELKKEADNTGSVNSNGATYIGSGGSIRHFNGSIDSVRIYNRALTTDEVRYHYNRGGPVGYWNFDEGSGTTAFDGTGNNNDGTLKSSGLEFDGVDDYVDCGSDSSLDITGDITVEAWIYTHSLTIEQKIVDKRTTWNGFTGYSFHINSNGDIRFEYGDGVTYRQLSKDIGLNMNEWTLVTATLSGSTVSFYKNGLFIETSAGVTGIAVDAANLSIGNSIGRGNVLEFDGSIDEVRIYNTALDAAEIARHYNNDFSQDPTANLVLLQHFEEGMACNANDEAGCLTDDSSGGVNDGTLKSFDNLTTWDNGTDGWISEVKKPEWRWVDGKYKTAGEFNGWDDYIEVADNDSLDMGTQITTEAWIYMTGGSERRTIASKWSSYFFEIVSDKLNVYLYGTTDLGWHISNTTVQSSTWQHVAFVYDGANVKFYINGIEDSNKPATSGDVTDTITSLVIGNTNLYEQTRAFNGSIDDVRIYNYARTADEIRLDYNAGVATHLGPSGKTCSEDPAGCMDYGLVGSWGMDEGTGTTAYDGSDNSNNGTLTNGPKWTTDSSPLAGGGGSLKFDGVDDYVDIGDVTNLELNFPLTIISWINLDTLPSSDESYEIISKYYSTGDKREWRFYVSSSSDKLSFWKGIDGTSTGAESITSDTAFLSGDLGNWFQAAVTIDGDGNGNIYRNGVNDKSSTFSNTTIYHSSAKAMIGCLNRSVTAPDNLFDGSIDSVRIYNRALSAEEVRYHYNKGGPVAEWGFDEGSGTTAFDGSNNNNDGTRTAGSTSGTVDSGSTTTLVDAALTQADDYWNDWTVKIVTTTDSLAPQGETATVTDFVAATDTLSFAALTAAVGAGDTYKIYYGDENGPTWTTGKYSSAMSFDGVDDYVDCGNGDSLNFGTDDFSVFAWVKFDTSVINQYFVNGKTVSNSRWHIYVNASNKMHIYLADNAANSVSTGALTYETDMWYHFGFVRNTIDGKIYIYRSGQLALTPATDTTVNMTSKGVNLGSSSGSNNWLDGTLDDVRIYNYARTADEIRLDYQAGVATHLGPSGKTCSEDPAGCMDYGLVGSWGMDEGTGTTAYDGSDNSNDGTLTNGPKWTTDSSPLAGEGGSLKFDGVDDYVDCGNDTSLNITDAITVSVWVKSSVFSTTYQNILLSSVAPTDYQGIHLYTRIAADNRVLFGVNNGTRRNFITVGNLNNNEWTHIVGTWDGATTMYVYINGTPYTETITSAPTLSNFQSLKIGYSDNSGTVKAFNGTLDEVLIYNRALSAEEVRYHYNKGGPVAEWKFDEGSGQTAYDESFNNNDGTLTNFGTTDTGTAESGGDDTLTDSDKAWSTNQWADGTITTTGGTGSGQSRTVSSNTGTVITLSSNWTTNPDATTTYSLVQAPTWTSGKYGSAIQFDGVDDYVNASANSSKLTNNTTLSLWMKLDTAIGSGVHNHYPGIFSASSSGGWDDFITFTYATSSLNRIAYEDASGSSRTSSLFSYNIGDWIHIAIAMDNSRAPTFYINGKLEGSGSASDYVSLNYLGIGYAGATNNGAFNGSIDDVRIYNYARTAEQIQMDYNAGVATHFR